MEGDFREVLFGYAHAAFVSDWDECFFDREIRDVQTCEPFALHRVDDCRERFERFGAVDVHGYGFLGPVHE